MSDEKTKKPPHDGKQIDINDPAEVKNWCRIFGITENQLDFAVACVGTSSTQVREFLEKKSRTLESDPPHI